MKVFSIRGGIFASSIALALLLVACATPQHSNRPAPPPISVNQTTTNASASSSRAAHLPTSFSFPALQNSSRQQIVNRVTWGVMPASLQQTQNLGVNQYLSQQLRASPPQLPSAIQAQIDAMRVTQTPLLKLMQDLERVRINADQNTASKEDAKKDYQQEMHALAREAASRSLLRSLYSEQQLQEQMVSFWMNHFNIHHGKHNVRAMLGDFEEHAIRPFALGRFQDLLHATATHPAMLRYLDNEHNAANKINENYARELMELHTMGVNGGYSQRDVQELARVLTGVGISINPDSPRMKPQFERLYVRQGMFEFNPLRHDFGA
ncbi:MAG: DUF1800 family protein, partial [Burkholderiales bacterium]|nr:DUF1800 family protein [Burkholderiales bacterium]